MKHVELKRVHRVDVSKDSGVTALSDPTIPVLMVEGMAVERAEGQGLIHTILLANGPGEPRQPYEFVLSPPAAAQLSKALRKAVRNYLKSSPQKKGPKVP